MVGLLGSASAPVAGVVVSLEDGAAESAPALGVVDASHSELVVASVFGLGAGLSALGLGFLGSYSPASLRSL